MRTMSRICPIIAAFLMAADAAAADFNLLDLIGGEVSNTSIAKAGRSRKRRPVRVERDDRAEAAEEAEGAEEEEAAAVTNVTVAATNVVESQASVESAATNAVEIVATNIVENVATNAAENVATNTAAATPKKKRPASTRPATITSRSTYYDRKDGFAVFTGSVHVDDEQYQMHADKAYVFFEGTNQLKRIVATGGVALTNGTRRAYGGKASYYRKSGMVVLYSSDNAPAEVRDEAEDRNQTVKGSKIKFWIDAEQVEVLDAQISAPAAGGVGDLKLK